MCLGEGVLLGERGVTEREFIVDWGNFGLEGRGLSVCLGWGVLLGERVVTEREFTVDRGLGGFRGGIGAERSEAKRRGAKRSGTKRG